VEKPKENKMSLDLAGKKGHIRKMPYSEKVCLEESKRKENLVRDREGPSLVRLVMQRGKKTSTEKMLRWLTSRRRGGKTGGAQDM